MNPIEMSINCGGRVLTLETGKLAKQADGAVLCRYGDSVVLATVVAGKEVKEGQGFFPLTVDFQEKFYAAGRIPGGFFKREARPLDMSLLAARLVDRPMRPLFPDDFMNETVVTITVLSHDGQNEPHTMGSIAASAALCISDIPFNGPVGTCRVGHINGNFVVNFPNDKAAESKLDLMVSGVRQGVVMVEGLAKEVSEQMLIDAIDFAHEQIQPILDMQEEMCRAVGKPKRDYPRLAKDESLKTEIRSGWWDRFGKAFSIPEKLSRYVALGELKTAIKLKYGVAEPKSKQDIIRNTLVDHYFEEVKYQYAREVTVGTRKRIDGRSFTDVRLINCETGILPRVHGSGLFTRGETQVLATVTLGTKDDEQKVDYITGIFQKGFLLHYNFPPFSVAEARPNRPPGRREIGHGTLAERALSYVIPEKEAFPYTIRLVSEVLESNGSSSMATVCSGSMALMDAGVPVKKAVAGVAMGLIKENDSIAILTDILGDEDHLGDMDFKVCGTNEGITAFQMDLKIGGVTREIMEKALAQARDGRMHILKKMDEAISRPKEDISVYAPRIYTMKVKPEKVREVIGAGGKVIRGIVEQTGVKIDIEDDGTIHIASADGASAQKAIDIINGIVEEPEAGKVYEGKVVRITDFGAFVEIIPGTDGLVHISELDHSRVRRVEDVVREGDIIKVKCLEIDHQGRVRLSRKALLNAENRPREPKEESESSSPADEDSEDSIGNRQGLDRFSGNNRSFENSRERRMEFDNPLDDHDRDRDRDRGDSYPRRDNSYGRRDDRDRSFSGGRNDRDRGGHGGGGRRMDGPRGGSGGGGGGGGGGRPDRHGSSRRMGPGRNSQRRDRDRGPRGGGGGGGYDRY